MLVMGAGRERAWRSARLAIAGIHDADGEHVFARPETTGGRAQRRADGKTTVDYGSYITHRWQNNDVPGTYLPTANPIDADLQFLSIALLGLSLQER